MKKSNIPTVILVIATLLAVTGCSNPPSNLIVPNPVNMMSEAEMEAYNQEAALGAALRK